MSTQEVIYIIFLSIPLYVSLICGLLHFRMFLMNDSPLGRKPLLLAVMAYMASTFGWLCIIFYMTIPDVFVFFNSFLLLAFTSIHVIYYHFIFEMTRIEKEEKFPLIHYFFPAFLSLCMLVWSLFIPFDAQLSFTQFDDIYREENKLYFAFYSAKPMLFFIWNIIYALFGLRRIIQFRKIVVNYSADEQRTSLTWLYQFLLAMLAAIPLAIIAISLPEGKALPFWILIVFMIILIFKDIIFAHNVLLDNFVIIRPDADDQQDNEINGNVSDTIKGEEIKRLEIYMHKNKPYLNPKLKITDMTRELATNRTSLSLLINRTYGMNFSRYVNRFRLEEFEKIRSNPLYAGLSELDQVLKAGFSDYRGYKRVKLRKDTLNSN